MGHCGLERSSVAARSQEEGWRERAVSASVVVWVVGRHYLSYWGHGKLQRGTRNGIAKVELILFGETLILRVGRSAVSRDEGVHCDVVCVCFVSVFFNCDAWTLTLSESCQVASWGDMVRLPLSWAK